MKPLKGIKVVSLAVNLPGPLLVSQLCKLGATAVKVEPPHGDPLRTFFPGYYHELLGRQKVVTADLLRDPKKIHGLLRGADVLVTSARADSLVRMGLGWGSLRKRYNKLIHLAVVSHAGDRAHLPGHDLTYQAEAGLLQPPAMPITPWADLAGAQEGVIKLLCALAERKKKGRGLRVEVALADALDSFTGPVRHGLSGSDTLLGGALPQYRIYPARDGWVALAALEGHFQERLRQVLQLDELSTERLEQVFSAGSAIEWQNWAEKHGIPLAAVKNLRKEK